MATKTGSLTGVGSVTLSTLATDSPPSNQAVVYLYGTYGTVTGVIEVSGNGSEWSAVEYLDRQTLTPANSLAPSDNSTLSLAVPIYGDEQIRFRATAVGSGTINVFIQSSARQPAGIFSGSSGGTQTAMTITTLTTNAIVSGTSAMTLTGKAGSSGAGGSVATAGGVGDTNQAGGAVSYTGGAGNGTGAGGAASLVGGASGNGASGNGGAVTVTGGASASTAGTGGAVTIASGASAGASGTAGAVSIDTGAANGGTAGAITIGGTNASGITLGANVTIANAKNIVLNSSTGTKIGTATTQKLSFYNATPIVQPAANTDTTTGAAGGTTTVFLNTSWTGSGGTAAYTIGGVVTALKALGLLAP